MKSVFIVAIILFCHCGRSPEGATPASQASDQKAVIALVKEVFQIECDHMKSSGKNISGLSTYDFRAEAFQQILKNPDRKLLQHYEIIYQQIADAEFHMSDAEKYHYRKEVNAIYAAGCP